MIRFKNNILPVWFQWDGDEASLERAKQTVIDDIKNNGLSNYTGYADEFDEPTKEEKEWDGSPDFTLTLKTEEAVKEEPVQEKTSKTTASSKTSKPKLPMDKFSEETPTKTEKTAS
tara:strand:- start:90 stop:437 length:348 start_codon:yes stop_codon:yes gene_type:complete